VSARTYPNGMELISRAEDLPADREAVPGETLISSEVWAALQGVSAQTVRSNKVRADARRRKQAAVDAGELDAAGLAARELPLPGDMPPQDDKFGGSPGWYMSTYRAWEQARPGKGRGPRPGRARAAKGRRARVELPVVCPHCHASITEADLADRLGRSRLRARSRGAAGPAA